MDIPQRLEGHQGERIWLERRLRGPARLYKDSCEGIKAFGPKYTAYLAF